MNKFIMLAYSPTKRLIALLIATTMLYQCTQPNKQTVENTEYRSELSKKLYNIRNEDSLLTILQQFSEEKNNLGKIICYKNLGSLQRAQGRLSDAISNHRKGLIMAIKLNDTIEIVHAMNNMGLNFQRLGAYGEASKYHYKALSYAEKWSGLHTPIGIRNHIMSLRGIGEISLLLGYYSDAKKNFKEVLKYAESEDTQEEGIIYSKLGTIFKTHQQYDSAYAYYQKSMELSKIAKSDKGIALSLIDIGELYEKEHKYDLAKAEYLKAFQLMDEDSNVYNWLYACLSAARIHLIINDFAEFKYYIQLAENTANKINSLEFLSKIYKLKYEYNIKQKNTSLALHNFTKHIALQDSAQGIQKAARYMEIRLEHVQNKNELELIQVNAANMIEQQKKEYVIYISWLITIFSFILAASIYNAYRQRSRKNKILKKLETVRSDFFTNITHEFRTPLTVIQGLNRQMQVKSDITEKERTTFIGAIERQSNNLLNLVNQLLDLAKLKKGADDPQWRRGNIIAYLEMAAEAFRLYALEKGVNLIFYSDIGANEMDFIPSYIDKIVSNLLSNAIKHTDPGGKIHFVVAKGKRPDTITIRISDTGEGIPQEDLKHIFNLFYQSPHAKNMSGTGIGLAFTEMMVEKMKGEIVVESEVDKGTVFTINLPLKNKELPYIPPVNEDKTPSEIHAEPQNRNAEYEEQTEKQKSKSKNTKPLVLIVEDNSDILLYLKSLLIDKYEVITAWNGEEGLSEAEQHIPDLVITDIKMPIKDGYQFVTEMKQNRLLDHIPVIMLTAKITDEDRIKGLNCGVEAYIRKPFQHEELLIRVENILKSRRVLKEKYMSAITRSGSDNKLSKDANMKFLQTINNIIYAELNNPELNSTFLADKMAMSISQLSRKINGITGYTTISYVLQMKLNKAKTMLEDNNSSITEVSDACGFYYVSYFSRAFKKEFGLTPSEYRKSAQFELKNL